MVSILLYTKSTQFYYGILYYLFSTWALVIPFGTWHTFIHIAFIDSSLFLYFHLSFFFSFVSISNCLIINLCLLFSPHNSIGLPAVFCSKALAKQHKTPNFFLFPSFKFYLYLIIYGFLFCFGFTSCNSYILSFIIGQLSLLVKKSATCLVVVSLLWVFLEDRRRSLRTIKYFYRFSWNFLFTEFSSTFNVSTATKIIIYYFSYLWKNNLFSLCLKKFEFFF